MRRAVRSLLGALAVMLAGAASAQTVSPAPDTVAVTIYRAPDRAAADAIDRGWLRGYALITERRRIAIPAGRTVVRFEGVAAGILAESAIVTGLPGGVREKNLDADLLSPRSLYAGSFGRPVTLRRTIAKRTVEEPAIIRSGPDGAAIVQTREGFVAVDCGPATESLGYPGVPPGLSAKPTLSVELESPVATQVSVTLSYLAWGFDWQANYVATLRPDGRSADLFAWVTLASGDTTSFRDAETMVVAGKVAREDSAPYPGTGRMATRQVFRCFAHPAQVLQYLAAAAPEAMDIVVTASRVMSPPPPPPPPPVMAQQEELGDLKLYRVPDRTTVAALAQKQVGLLARTAVPVQRLYRAKVDASGQAGQPQMVLRALNKAEQGLGIPLPAGPVAVFQRRGGTPLLVGAGALTDKAVGEEVEVELADATNVTVQTATPDSGRDGAGAWEGVLLTARNANPFAVRFEAQFDARLESRLSDATAVLARANGTLRWSVELPAGGTRTFGFRIHSGD